MKTNRTTVIMLIALMNCLSTIVDAADTTTLIQAMIRVESSDRDRVIGDLHMKEKAYGPLQARQPCVDDVNRRYGTKISAQDLNGDRVKSVWVCQKYLEMYATQKRLGKEPTHEDMARIWNGGPNGWKHSGTKVYWSKVRKQMETIELAEASKKKGAKPKISSSELTLVAKR